MNTEKRLITRANYQEYLKLRSLGHSAMSAGYYLRHTREANEPIEWQEERNNRCSGPCQIAVVKCGKFQVKLEINLDEFPDLPFLGEYQNSQAIDGIDRKARGNWERNQYRYWNPTASLEGDIQGYQKLGYSRHVSWLNATRNRENAYQRHEAYNNGHWWMINMTATAFIGDVECGFASLGGIESDAGEDYINEVAHNLIVEALEDAKNNRDRLIKQRAQEIALLAD